MDFKKKYPNLKVIPTKIVEHTKYNELIGVRGHRNYYVNLLSGKITYIKRGIKISTDCQSIMEAQDRVQAELERRKTGKTVETIKRELRGELHPFVGDIWKEMMRIHNPEWKAGTRQTYLQDWSVVLEKFWAKKTTADITDDSLVEFREWYLENFPTRQSRKTMIHLKKCFKLAVELGHLQKLPKWDKLEVVDDLVKRNNNYEKAGRPLDASEVEKLLAAIDKFGSKKGAYGLTVGYREMIVCRTRLAIYLGLFCGMRINEALGLRWDKVNFETGFISVWSSKNSKWRVVPIPSKKVRLALVGMKKHSGGSKWVFPLPSNPDRHLYDQILDKAWNQIRKNSGISDAFRFHDLRHTFATKTAEDNWPPILACEILDMSLKTYSETYCRPSTESKIKLMAKERDLEV